MFPSQEETLSGEPIQSLGRDHSPKRNEYHAPFYPNMNGRREGIVADIAGIEGPPPTGRATSWAPGSAEGGRFEM
jgi:hypothetical protein